MQLALPTLEENESFKNRKFSLRFTQLTQSAFPMEAGGEIILACCKEQHN